MQGVSAAMTELSIAGIGLSMPGGTARRGSMLNNPARLPWV
jgi:hypothetical protein